MKEILHEDFNENTFKLIGNDWMLLTAEKEGKVNTMTASWGGLRRYLEQEGGVYFY